MMKFALILVLTFVVAQYLNSTAHSIGLYALVTLPGTVFHELAHFMMAALLDGNPQNFSIIPSGNTLGSITFYPNWYNAATVSLAPLLLAPFTFLMAAIAANASNPLKVVTFSYLASCSWVACTPSSQDFSIALVPTSWPLALVFLSASCYTMFLLVRALIK